MIWLAFTSFVLIIIDCVGSGSSDGADADGQLDSSVASSCINTDPGPLQTGISSSTLQSSTDQPTEASTTIVELQRVQPADFLCMLASCNRLVMMRG